MKMDQEIQEDIVNVGSYILVQKQNYRKLVKVADKGTFTLGKEQIEMVEIVGKPYWTTFKMISSKNGRKHVGLEIAEKADTMEDLCVGLTSGRDNRGITDDGNSQKLSKEEIEDLRDAGKSSKEIVGSLISNSSSFSAKTEFSQEKYIKKKEKKYYRFLTILKPSISMIQEIYFRQDYTKINCLRMETLSQILSYCDVKAEGKFLLYDSGSCGLPAGALLNRIGANTTANLVHLHPGNQAQLTLVQAMNFPEEQMKRMHTVNLYTFLRLHYQGEADIIQELVKKHNNWKKIKDESNKIIEDENDPCAKRQKLDENLEIPDTFREPRWLNDTRKAVDCFKTGKADGLAIIAKEHPSDIIEALLPFLGSSRPFIIYHNYREPLQETYVNLKQRKDIVNLRLLTNFCRGYQILPNRTHPEITTNDLGGYILSGYIVD